MQSWASFYPHVLPDVLGCPYPTVDHALRDAAREFCLTTAAWQDATEIMARGGHLPFEFDTPAQTEVVKVARASVAGKDLPIFAQLPADWAEHTPKPGLYAVDREQFRVFPQPLAAQVVSVTLALRPSTTGTGVGDEVFARHAEDIAAGAKARLLRSPRKEWTDLAQAGLYRSEFERAMHWAANVDFLQTRHAERRVKAWG